MTAPATVRYTVDMNEQALLHIKKNLDKYAEGFLSVLGENPKRAVRINTLKADPEDIAAKLGLSEKTVYSGDAFIAPECLTGAHPYHHGGLLYFQEPSAMLSVEAARPYLAELTGSLDYPLVLDMCAAPGGKSGQIAELLKGRGALVSNEIDYKRAKVLSSNLERLGVRNCAVTSSSPDRIAEVLGNIFDAVIVDAPCSGEGMLRKEKAAWDNMNFKTMLACAERQSEIMSYAVNCLKEGGLLVYSTCTLNETENEMTLLPLIESGELEPLECPHLKLVHRSARFAAYRALPQDGGGEGHFVCVMRKLKGGASKPKLKIHYDKVLKKSAPLEAVLSKLCKDPIFATPCFSGDNIFLCPLLPPLSGLNVIRAGAYAASVIKNGFVPSHGYAAALKRDDMISSLDFHYETGDENEKALGRKNIESYLRGEQLECPETYRDWGLICADSFPLGLIKMSGGLAKNHYPKGLRNK